MNKYILDFKVPIPNGIQVVEPPEPGSVFPKKFGPVSRVPDQETTEINGFKVIVGPPIKELHPNITKDLPNFGIMQILIFTEGESVIDAINKTKSTVELIIDSFTFQLQIGLKLMRLEIYHMDKKFEVGDDITISSIIDPSSIVLPKYYINNQNLGQPSRVFLKPTLNKLLKVEKRDHQILLWWYTKCLHSPYVLDRIAFIFIVIDKISQPHKKGPYKASCGHLISKCPECDTSIDKTLNGDSIKEFLIEKGFSITEANMLWKVRQIMHGKDYFDFEELFNVSVLANRLMTVVANELKVIFGFGPDEMPIFNGLVSGSMATPGIDMKAKVDESILAIQELFSLR